MALYLLIWAVLVLIIFVFHYNWRRRHLYLAASKFNGPPALPIIGNAIMFIGNNEVVLMKLFNLTKNSPNLEPIRFWLGPMLIIFFMNPHHVEKIVSSSKFAQKHDIYAFIGTYLGEGLVSGSGLKYKEHRRIIQPMFDLNFTKECICIFQKHIDLCLDKLENYVDKGTIDIHTNIHKCMIDIMKEILTGQEEKCQLNGLNEFDQAMIDIYDLSFSRMVKPYLQPDILYNFTPYKKQQDKMQKILRNYGKTIINACHKRRKVQKTANEFSPIIDRLMDYRKTNPGIISDEVLIDHMNTLHAASEDTFTLISGFISVCFGMYPEYQEKAANEIREIFGETPRPVTMDDINRLHYVNMCLKEVLRLFPIAPVILRKCTEVFELEQWTIPEGCAIALPIFTIHRDARFWENPEHFYPDHFLPENENKRPVYAYAPFSAGPRGCIGKIIANIGQKIYICNLLQRFKIEADGKLPDLQLKMDIMTRSKHGYRLRLKKRVWT